MRKTKLTYEIVERAIELKRDGLCDADIIDALGIHPSTFYRWQQDPNTKVKRALCDGLKKAETEYKRQLLVTIRQAALSKTQHWTAAAWLLERKFPQQFGKAERKTEEEGTGAVQLTLGLEIAPIVESDGMSSGSAKLGGSSSPCSHALGADVANGAENSSNAGLAVGAGCGVRDEGATGARAVSDAGQPPCAGNEGACWSGVDGRAS